MPQVINTNIASLSAQRALNTSQSEVTTSLERLSSGLRINGASDDAAGLAISERFNSQIRGLNQAVRNSNDAISLAQTADNSLSEVTNNLQRIRELAVQSANSSNSSSDRAALQTEVSQLIAEIDRVASQTKFNGIALLDGSFTSQAFQVGADAGQTISVSSIVSAATADLGRKSEARIAGTEATTALSAGDLLVNGVDVGAVTTTGNFAQKIATAIQTASAGAVTATVGQTDGTDLGAFTDMAGGASAGTFKITIDGTDIFSLTGLTTLTDAEVDTQLASTAVSDTLTYLGVSFTGTAVGNNLRFQKASGDNLTVSYTSTSAGTASAFANLASGATDTSFGKVSLASESAINLSGAAETSAGFTNNQAASVALQSGTTVANSTVATVTGANAAITSMDNALATINAGRASLGALQNRFDSVVSNLQTASENASAARSRIVDADFAAETAALTRGQILQQAGIAVLAQANAAPQNVLALLQ